MDSESPAKTETWKEKLLRNWMQTRLAHEGMMIGKIRSQNKIVQDNVKKMSGLPSGGDDDMGDVNIGNEMHNHYDSQTTSSQPQQQQQQGMSTLAKALLAAALLAGGAGVGYMVAGDKTGDLVDTNTDTNTTYTWDGGLGTPPEGE